MNLKDQAIRCTKYNIYGRLLLENEKAVGWFIDDDFLLVDKPVQYLRGRIEIVPLTVLLSMGIEVETLGTSVRGERVVNKEWVTGDRAVAHIDSYYPPADQMVQLLTNTVGYENYLCNIAKMDSSSDKALLSYNDPIFRFKHGANGKRSLLLDYGATLHDDEEMVWLWKGGLYISHTRIAYSQTVSIVAPRYTTIFI